MSKRSGIYLDCNATTPVDPMVVERMLPWFSDNFGNPASRDHAWGWDAAEAVDRARHAVAEAAGCIASEVFFASSATDAISAAIQSYVALVTRRPKRIITTGAEHDAVLAPCRYLNQRGTVELSILPVDDCGRIDLDLLCDSLGIAPGCLVILTAANHEIGTLYPVRTIARIVQAAGGRFLCDTTQAFGKSQVNFHTDGADLASISAHKIYGPKGIAALLARSGATRDGVESPNVGGRHSLEHAGTLNVPGIIGLGEACRIAAERLDDDISRIELLRDRLEAGILSQVPDTWINGDRSSRLCNTTNVGFRSVDARAVIRELGDVAVSTKSACSTGDSRPSRVLKALGLSDMDARSCVRFSLGRFNTDREMDYVIEKVVQSANRLRRKKSLRA